MPYHPESMKRARSTISDPVTTATDQSLFTAFRDATGMGIRLISAGCPETSKPLASADNPFCALLVSMNPESKPCSRWCEAATGLAKRRTPLIQQCRAGLMHVIAPVVREGLHVATLEGGQVFCRRPAEGDFNSVLDRFPGWREQEHLPKLRTAYFQTPVLNAKQLEAAVHLLSRLSESVTEALLRQTTAGETSHSRHIERARAFLDAHLTETITLRQVARHVNLCPAYFCRLFKRESGCTFFGYLAQARVQRAQRLLHCSSRPITEIAYAAGFHSLCHFNHVFKGYTGFTPTQYRAQQ